MMTEKAVSRSRRVLFAFCAENPTTSEQNQSANYNNFHLLWAGIIFWGLILLFPSASNSLTVDSIYRHIDPTPYDLFYIDSSITVNDGYTYTTDSLAVIAILKANGWGMPIKDSAYAYSMQLTVEDISAKVNGRIAKLNLDGWLLSICWAAYGTVTHPPLVLPSDIGKLTALQYLNISGNALDSLPPEIGNLPTLFYLGCDQNRITTLPASIGNLKKLKDLDLIGNPYLTELPSSINNLTNLVGLALRDNNLDSLPDGFGNFPELIDLSLSGNRIKTLPHSIGNMKKLQYLEIVKYPTVPSVVTYGSLVNIPNEIGNCDNLLFLLIDGNQLTNLPDSIVNLTKCNVWVDSNYLCSGISCPVQQWLNLHSDTAWWKRQRCTDPLPPSCDSNRIIRRAVTMKTAPAYRGTVKIYDLHGNFICSTRSSFSTLKLPAGTYISKYPEITGIKPKLINMLR